VRCSGADASDGSPCDAAHGQIVSRTGKGIEFRAFSYYSTDFACNLLQFPLTEKLSHYGLFADKKSAPGSQANPNKKPRSIRSRAFMFRLRS